MCFEYEETYLRGLVENDMESARGARVYEREIVVPNMRASCASVPKVDPHM